MKPKHITYLIFYGFIVLILGVVLWHTGKMMVVKEQMERYLREKYGKEFVVRNVGYTYPYIGGKLEIKGNASPVDDQNLQFQIVRVAEGGVLKKYSSYGEFPSFINNLWAKQARSNLINALESNLVYVGIWFDEKKGELTGKTINLNDAERLFKSRIELTIVDTKFISASEYISNFEDYSNLINGRVSANQAKTLYTLIEKLKNDNYKKISLVVLYYDQKYQKYVEEQINAFFKKGIYDFNIPEDYLLCKTKIENINDIDKPDDIRNHISTKIADHFLSEGKRVNE